MRYLCIFCCFLCLFFAFVLPASAVNYVDLSYVEWLIYYNHTDGVYDMYLDRSSNPSLSVDMPILVSSADFDDMIASCPDFDDCDALFDRTVFADDVSYLQLSYLQWLVYYMHQDAVYDKYMSILSGELINTNFPVSIEVSEYDDFISNCPAFAVNSGVSVSSLAVDDSSAQTLAVSANDDSSVSTLSIQPVPTSGSSYIQPELVNVEYAPDAPSGSLLSVLYSFVGKPVQSYTYRVQSSSSNSNYSYVTDVVDYDANWIVSCLLLMLFVYCLFKLGGGLFCRT